MKKNLFYYLFAVLCTVSLFTSCSDDDDNNTTSGGGESENNSTVTISLEDADIDQTQEITSDMKVVVNVTAPAGIADFKVTIDSPALTDDVLETMGLSTELDLVNPATDAMSTLLSGFGFPVGTNVSGKTDLSFDISSLVPMISLIYNEDSDHKFILTVTDANGITETKTLTCHLTVTSTIAYNEDANLWTNTATVTATHLSEGASVQYRIKDADTWTDATLTAENTYTLAPAWKDSINNVGLTVHQIQEGTGIFAAQTYEVRIVENDQEVASTSFTTADGDEIPNGDMSGWSTKSGSLSYPNAEGDSFWDSGNNSFTTSLCTESEGTALLKPKAVNAWIIKVFAAGNLFTGNFNYASFTGTASFGQNYTWTARPRAMKLRYKATVGAIDYTGSYDPFASSYKNQQDTASVFVAVVNWSSPRKVISGTGAPSGMWNPATASSLDEGAILGYGQELISQSTSDWVEVTIPVVWYDTEAENPSDAAYSLVISCSTSQRGDYLTGCSSNELQVDDFSWVY